MTLYRKIENAARSLPKKTIPPFCRHLQPGVMKNSYEEHRKQLKMAHGSMNEQATSKKPSPKLT